MVEGGLDDGLDFCLLLDWSKELRLTEQLKAIHFANNKFQPAVEYQLLYK